MTPIAFNFNLFHNSPTSSNQEVSREKLLQLGRQAAPFAIRAKTAFFTSANPLHCLFSMVNRGNVRFIRAATNWQFLTRSPLFATLNREKFSVVCKPVRKAFIMQKQSKTAPQSRPSQTKIQYRQPKVSNHSRAFKPLLVRKIRTFSSFQAASRYIDMRLNQKPDFMFNIQQTANGWNVSRVMGA
ncbi:hypothetical protein QDY71_02365 [Kingella negevensis]|uniref:Uncharacterized protein n=1 Tax=Kingella negevensis TaxID=1522312 RepID=A0A238HFD7_9NEIS|nr:hypothetical protein [Kingella negevensis]MDK4680306.1 hypothetical protein [Kingella negevensis]MDK4681974.1 hypothetical protein [Kingella negevensis]MDK4684808.1 hypothetical protein [Kingella negevensis]MDK4690170.1 hypothetical protein [Kingella negevensis]MDK4692485.1 hypothetical protein [Kingella negevensis]